jgi:hypothetical protein
MAKNEDRVLRSLKNSRMLWRKKIHINACVSVYGCVYYLYLRFEKKKMYSRWANDLLIS